MEPHDSFLPRHRSWAAFAAARGLLGATTGGATDRLQDLATSARPV
jgi:hypothetical protein